MLKHEFNTQNLLDFNKRKRFSVKKKSPLDCELPQAEYFQK